MEKVLCWGSGTASSVLPWSGIFIIVLPIPAVPVSDGTGLENRLRARLAELPSAFAVSHLFYILIVQFTATSSNVRAAFWSQDTSIFQLSGLPEVQLPTQCHGMRSISPLCAPWPSKQRSSSAAHKHPARAQSLFQSLQKEQWKLDLQSSDSPKDCISKLRRENLFLTSWRMNRNCLIFLLNLHFCSLLSKHSLDTSLFQPGKFLKVD